MVVSFDLIIEYIFGQNIFGFKAELPGRLVGFFKDEMKIGHFYSAFILIALVTINNFLDNLKNINDRKFFKEIIFFSFAAFFSHNFFFNWRESKFCSGVINFCDIFIIL